MRPFVLLARAVDVEVTEADDGALELRDEAADVVVEDQLGVAVDVERALVGGDFGERGASSVDGGRGGVDEGDLAVGSEVEQLLRVGEVVVHHVAAVVFEGVGAGALMEDGANFGVLELAGLESGAELALVHVVGELGAVEVEELGAGEIGGRGKVVDDEDVALTTLVELLDEIAADKAGATGNDNQRQLLTSVGSPGCEGPSLFSNLSEGVPPPGGILEASAMDRATYAASMPLKSSFHWTYGQNRHSKGVITLKTQAAPADLPGLLGFCLWILARHPEFISNYFLKFQFWLMRWLGAGGGPGRHER
jgi:hypothetical protein